MNQPKTHGAIVLRAIQILENDGLTQAAGYFNQNRQALLAGTRQADHDGGKIILNFKLNTLVKEFELLSEEIPANTMSHFYNPSTGRGLELFRDAGAASTAISIANTFSIGPWQLYTLLGPQPAATDMADWFYAQAVDQMRLGHAAEAMMYLGKSLHMIADLTVPQHSTDRHGGYPGANHLEYESACDAVLAQITHASTAKDLGDLYTNSSAHTPGWIGQLAAKQSAPLLTTATKQWAVGGPPNVTIENDFASAAAQMIPIAEKLSAVLLRRFWEQWEHEQFMVTVLRIDRVKALDGNIDNESDADLYAEVRLAGRWYYTGTIVGEDDIQPQVLTPYAWFFPRWSQSQPDSVPVRIEMWDEDGGLNGGDDKVDITPVKGYALDLNYWPANRQVTGDVSKQGPDYYVEGNPDDHAAIWFRIDHAPTTTVAGPLPCSVKGSVQDSAGQPARGSYLFFMPEGASPAKWQHVAVSDSGGFNIPFAKTGNYLFRPAGSGYNFEDVPRLVKLLPGVNTIDFKASGKVTLAGLDEPVQALPKPEQKVFAAQQNDKVVAAGDLVLLGADEARALLEDDALVVQSPKAELGVKQNGLGYAASGSVLVHLASVIDPETGIPLPNTDSVNVVHVPLIPTMPDKTVPMVLGGAATGPGVAGAQVRATLWLGNSAVGFNKAGEVTGTTNADGDCAFWVKAGTHPETARVSLQVMSNPANPWCRPKLEGDDLLLFRPRGKGDDLYPHQPYELTLPLHLTKPTDMTMQAAVDAVLFGAEAGGSIDDEQLAQAYDTVATGRFAARYQTRQAASQGRSDPRLRAGVRAGSEAQPETVRGGRITAEAESLLGAARVSGGDLTSQDMTGFGRDWGGGSQLFWRPPAPVPDSRGRYSPSLTVQLTTPQQGRYRVLLYFTQASDYADAAVSLGGNPAGTLRGYARAVQLHRMDLGLVTIGPRGVPLVLMVQGKDRASTGYLVGLDRVELLPE